MMKLVLIWKEGAHTHEFPVPNDRETTIGRYQCDITLSEQTVSRRHASIVAEDNVYYLHNLSRVNPIVVNGDVTLYSGQKTAIEPGDQFRLGPVMMAVSKTALKNLVPKLKCTNCGNVNEYSPEAQCKYCGRNLSSGETIMIQG